MVALRLSQRQPKITECCGTATTAAQCFSAPVMAARPLFDKHGVHGCSGTPALNLRTHHWPDCVPRRGARRRPVG